MTLREVLFGIATIIPIAIRAAIVGTIVFLLVKILQAINNRNR